MIQSQKIPQQPARFQRKGSFRQARESAQPYVFVLIETQIDLAEAAIAAQHLEAGEQLFIR